MRSLFPRLRANERRGCRGRRYTTRAAVMALTVLGVLAPQCITRPTFAQDGSAFDSSSDPQALPRPLIQQVGFDSQIGAQQPTPAQPLPSGPVRVPASQYEQSAPSSSSAFGPTQVRLPLLGGTVPTAGTTPHPSAAVLERYKQYVDRTIDPENTLDLMQGRPRVLMLKQAPLRVQLADEQIASYTIVTPTEISIVGNHVGSTVLNFWFTDPEGGRQTVLSYLLRVIPDPEQKERLDRVYKALEGEINRAFPNSAVKLALLGDKLVVSGEAKDIVEAAQILRIVSANAPGGSRERDGGATEIPVGNLNVTAIPDASGNLPQQGLENFLLRDVNRNVVNLLRVSGEQQVQLRVTVAEVNRTAARSIGLDFSVLNAAGTAVFSSTTGGLIPTTVTGMGSSAQLIGGNLPAIIDNGKVTLAIQALRNLNLARSLAEQNLVALNGQTARFRAGGEFPVPAATLTFGAVGQGVSFIPFGVQMQFVPYITDRDRIRLQVGATVSTLDPSLGTSIGGSAGAGGTTVPGLNSRTFQTTVELRSGQTFAVAGLTQTTFGATTVRVPFFGDLPIVGSLAGENQTSHGEQEVMILITPELTHPLQECATPPVAGSDVFEPGDVEFYLLNRLESRRSYDYRSSVRTDCARQKRYEHCDDVFIIGAHGQANNCCPSCGTCYPAPVPVPDPNVPREYTGPRPESIDSGKAEVHLPSPTVQPIPVPQQPTSDPSKP